MTLAACRVALRKIRSELRAAVDGEGAADGDAGLVILSSATKNALYLGELLLPVRVREREREGQPSPPLFYAGGARGVIHAFFRAMFFLEGQRVSGPQPPPAAPSHFCSGDVTRLANPE